MEASLAEIEAALRLVNREVWIVTSSTGTKRGGLCATWVSGASIDPERPTVVIGLAPNHFTSELVSTSLEFGLHLLRADQAQLALTFATTSGRDTDKLAGLKLVSDSPPLLADCLARFQCRVYHQLNTGDRVFFWADVLSAQRNSSESPLREHEMIAAATEEQRRILADSRRTDGVLLTPFGLQWRAEHASPSAQ